MPHFVERLWKDMAEASKQKLPVVFRTQTYSHQNQPAGNNVECTLYCVS